MNASPSDALVFFGATGDLIYKKIFPNLYAMERRGNLKVPIIGVAKSDWTLERFRGRARESIEKHGGVFRGYLQEDGVARDSKVETFAAARLHIGSARWDGVPFFIRAGKSLRQP